MRFNVTITFSKIFALVMLSAAVFVDLHNHSSLCLPICLPLVAVVIGFKQYTRMKTDIEADETSK